MECMEGDKVWLGISPIKGVMRFGKKGKLNPRHIGLLRSLNKKEKWPIDLLCHPVYPRFTLYVIYLYYDATFLMILICYPLIGWS